jgi:hypothetical protein
VDGPTRIDNADEIEIGITVARFRFSALDDRTRSEQPGPE